MQPVQLLKKVLLQVEEHSSRLSDGLEDLSKSLEGDQRTGVEIIKRALTAPTKQIAINAGFNGDVVVSDIKRLGKGLQCTNWRVCGFT